VCVLCVCVCVCVCGGGGGGGLERGLYHVHVANKVITLVLAHVHLLNGPILFRELPEHVLKELIVVLLQLFFRHCHRRPCSREGGAVGM
jgi:hypothetical protein